MKQHPQYAEFILIMTGFLLQWPTLLTLLMFLVLVVMYAMLARRGEADVGDQFGEEREAYASRTPAFVPRWFGVRLTTSLRAEKS